MNTELVLLCDEQGNPLGTREKALVHTTSTPLHRAFSCHIFDPQGNVLVTRRALSKLTWPGVWTNSVCGHPGVDESDQCAIIRRAADELGLRIDEALPLVPILPQFRYRAVDTSGIVENEICPVYAITLTQRPKLDLNPAEVMEATWVPFADFVTAASAAPFAFSPWAVKQLDQWPC
ncbi:isopentenyl-diphosphate Delta-isomerase [Boudabousia marimammalium]|nr:isopentenyl-diphosphate Delta-isomerase [Boudabousia marimammalium]